MMTPEFRHERLVLQSDVVLWRMFGRPTERDWLDVLADNERWMLEQESRGKKWGMIIDPTQMASDATEMHRATGQWRADNMPLIANTCSCAAYVANSALWRGAITAIFWFAKPIVPVAVRATQQEAKAWILEKMRPSGIALEGALPR